MSNWLNGKGINTWVFWPPFLVFLLAGILSLVAFETFTGIVDTAFSFVVETFGWLFALTAFGVSVLLVVVFLSPAGKIRFGGKDAKPEFTTWQWFAMSLAAGIGTGIVFWGVAEPVTHLAFPPEGAGLEPYSAAAAYLAIAVVFLHWTITPYFLYDIFTIPVALAFYNYNQPFRVSSALYFLIGDKCHGWIGKAIDALSLFAIAGGAAAALGAGLLQLGSGLNFLYGIPISPMLWAAIALVVIAVYTISSITGLHKGIRFLSDQNTKLFFAVLIFVFVAGPTLFILDFGTQGFGQYISNFVSHSLFLSPVEGSDWPVWWTIFYWANWMAFAPIVGLFLARLARGRTIREFIAVNTIAPAVFGMVWFAVFGGAGIHAQLNELVDIAGLMGEHGTEYAFFAFFEIFPMSDILSLVFIIMVGISFVTLADSMTSTVAMVSTTGIKKDDTEEAPVPLKLIWGIVIGVAAVVMITYAGVDGFKMLSDLAGFPIMFIIILTAASLVKGLWYPHAVWFKNVGSIDDQKSHKG